MPPSPRVLIVGAGMSGLCLAIQLKRAGFDSFTIIEKSHQVGGTWHENSYPNSGCDVPSYLYSFSFAPKYDWTLKYARQPEIFQYFRDCADKFGINSHIRFSVAVESARFDENRSVWVVNLSDGETLEAEFFVSAVGQLNRPKIPDFPGLDRFQGAKWHSANWNHNFDLKGKRVAVVGNGASAVQFVPTLAEQAERTFVYQRSPNWIQRFNNYRYSEFSKRLFRAMPWTAKMHRIWIFAMNEWRIRAIVDPWIANPIYHMWIKWRMGGRIRKDLRPKLIPNYTPGCKRILLSNDFLETLQRPDVEVITDPITGFTADSIETTAGSTKIDAVIFATGFESLDFLQPMEIQGRDGVTLNAAWRERPKTLLGLATPGFPNLFMLYGPNTNLGHNSIIYMVESQVDYIIKCLRHMQANGLGEIEVTPEAVEKFDRKLQRKLRRTVWAGECTSWYKKADGSITNNWYGAALEYRWATRKPNFSQFKLKPSVRETQAELVSG
jgi:cation diffusion facilitator CzcD-associated flavoprotein CzcO